jgi:hypothetical protein
VLVFSGYDGTLCDDEEYDLRASSTLADGRGIDFLFKYAGQANAAGDCVPRIEGVGSAYQG